MGLVSIMNNKDDKCVFQVVIAEFTKLTFYLFIDQLAGRIHKESFKH